VRRTHALSGKEDSMSVPRQRHPARYPFGAIACGVALILALSACGGGDGGDEAATADETGAAVEAAGGETAAARSACEVLTGADASAILGQTVDARPDPDDPDGPAYSSCGYYPGEGYGVMYLSIYWSGGRDQWEAWQTATAWAGQTWEQAEKVSLDSITGASLVGGLGDRAQFGGILPSFVLKDDILLEFKLPLVMEEEKRFPLLAKAALARLD
jgi:hypothetical protein